MNMPLTNIANEATKTNKTEETNPLSNSQFLGTVFGEELSDVRPVLVSFKDNPATAPGKAWFGRPWSGSASTALPANANNYFSLAVFQPDESGRYRRQKARFVALHAVMLDDVGTKVPAERLTLPPTWLLETSAGNYQAGYLLVEPLTDGTLADRLMNAIVAAGLCDPGANGPCARLARLPVAVNAKHDPPFRCQLTIWAPERRYSVEEIIEGLQLDIGKRESRPAKNRSNRPAGLPPQNADQVRIPRPDENAVVAALRARGLYKAPLGKGKHDVACPWVNEHTDALDSGTAYFEPDDHWPIGGFKCLHGHCAGRHISDLLEELDVEEDAARMKSTIWIVSGEVHRVVDAAERELANSQRYYQRGGLIVTVTTDPTTLNTMIQEVSQPALLRALAGAAIWRRYDARSKDWVRTDPPALAATILLNSLTYPHLPGLIGLARQPYMRPDGTVMREAGYDRETCMFGIFDARAFSVPQSPSQTEAMSALALLRDLLSEFDFSAQTDESAALAALLTAAIRPSLPRAPFFHVKAHTAGSGKSYLCELITSFATPQRGTPTAFPRGDEECRKFLLAELLRAPAVIEFDNLTYDLTPYKSLCMALTSEYMSGRILGVSKTATVSTRALFLSSGNNVGPIRDMARRCVTIHLSPQCEVPACRTFQRPDLVREVLSARGRFVSAALTIILAWIAAGRPMTTCKAFAGYGEWSDLCRQPLLWLGCEDPTESVFEALAQDPGRTLLSGLLTAWVEMFGKSPVMVREVLQQAQKCQDVQPELLDLLRDIAEDQGGVNPRKLGWWIRRHEGRIVDNKRIVRAQGNGPAERWKVEIVESVSSVFSVSDSAANGTVNTPDGAKAYAHASRGE